MPSRAEVAITLDTEALRHLVAQESLAKALWTGPSYESLRAALLEIHGESGSQKIQRKVNQQVLLTKLKLLPSLLQRIHEDDQGHAAYEVLQNVEDIIAIKRNEPKSIDCGDAVLALLQEAVLQASLRLLFLVDREGIEVIYRKVVDLIRGISSALKEEHPFQKEKKYAIRLVKQVAMALNNAARKDALMEAQKFLRGHPNTRTARALHEQARALSAQLKPPILRRIYTKTLLNIDEKKSSFMRDRKSVRKKRKVRGSSRKPMFFSDASDESEIEGQNGHAPNGRDTIDEIDDATTPNARESFYDSPELSARNLRGRSRKRHRLSPTHICEDSEDVSGITADLPAQSSTPISRTRSRKYPAMVQELNDMTPSIFSDKAPDGEHVDHVVRHAKLRRGRQVRHKQIPAKRITRGTKVLAHGSGTESSTSSQDRETTPKSKGIDRADPNAIAAMGTPGAVLQELHDKARELGTQGPSDPLPEAMQDARQAERRREKANDLLYDPGSDARSVTPISSESDESTLPRIKASRLILKGSPAQVHAGRRSRQDPGTRSELRYLGKICKSGRFDHDEDQILLSGLELYGWGAWAEIAKQFCDREWVRAPSSLKDRARTLGLSPSKYQRKFESRGRPRRPVSRPDPFQEADKDAIEDRDEDEGDHIEPSDDHAGDERSQ